MTRAKLIASILTLGIFIIAAHADAALYEINNRSIYLPVSTNTRDGVDTTPTQTTHSQTRSSSAVDTTLTQPVPNSSTSSGGRTSQTTTITSTTNGVTTTSDITVSTPNQATTTVSIPELIQDILRMDTSSAVQGRIETGIPYGSMFSSDRTPTATAQSCTTHFAITLGLGDTGPEVREMQVFLNAQGFRIAESGQGSAGNETAYFGLLTKAAVIRFQEKYAEEILTPSGLTAGNGRWGPATRTVANRLYCAQ
jgi:hypothetical protein